MPRPHAIRQTAYDTTGNHRREAGQVVAIQKQHADDAAKKSKHRNIKRGACIGAALERL